MTAGARRLCGAAVAALAVAGTLLGCGAQPGGERGGAAQTPPPTAPTKDTTCETLIPDSLVDQLHETDWVSKQDDFRIGPTIIDGGIYCVWGNAEVASDHVQIYGWAGISAEQSKQMQEYLADQGWKREKSKRGVYLTEAAPFSPDDKGYGMTYLFGDGWVTVADTKQGLVLIRREG